jgi:HKD family nuclease
MSEKRMTKVSGVRIGVVENSGPNTLVSYLRNAGTTTTQIDIAVAFITTAGLDSVTHVLKRASQRGQVRLITGLYQGFTEPKALRTLLREQEQSDGRFLVQISADPHFHWKTYFLMGKTTANAVIGSSNLTDDGLRQTGEFNVVLSMQKTSKPFRELHAPFEKHWQARSKPLTEELLCKYEEWRASASVHAQMLKVPLRKILAMNRRKSKAVARKEPVFWRSCTDGLLSTDTQAMLTETTDWDRRGYDYISNSLNGFSVGDRVVLFDLNRRIVEVVEIKDTTRTPRRTPDGFYFAGYRVVRGIGIRKLIPNRWRSLKAAGLIRLQSDVHMTRRLSVVKYDSFVENLKEDAR